MFDLEKSIADWRRHMRAAGVKNPVVLDELESHLREDVERRMRSGVTAEQAFSMAVESVGQPVALQNEFAKAAAMNGTRLQRMKAALLRCLGLPPQPPSLFTADARESLQLGRKEALGFHHDFIGTEHVLLGLLESEDGSVRAILQSMGVDSKIVRKEIEKIVGLGPSGRSIASPPFTPRVKKALEIAAAEARALRQTHVGNGHILLGLLKEGGGVAAVVLKSLGINRDTARAEILKVLLA